MDSASASLYLGSQMSSTTLQINAESTTYSYSHNHFSLPILACLPFVEMNSKGGERMVIVPPILAIFKYSSEHVSVMHGQAYCPGTGTPASLTNVVIQQHFHQQYRNSHLNKCCHFLKNQVPLHLIFSIETMRVVLNFI